MFLIEIDITESVDGFGLRERTIEREVWGFDEMNEVTLTFAERPNPYRVRAVRCREFKLVKSLRVGNVEELVVRPVAIELLESVYASIVVPGAYLTIVLADRV